MDLSKIPIHVNKAASPQISREKLIKVYSNIALQFYPSDGRKVKVANLFMELRTHRAVLEDKADPSRYFEIHFDRLLAEPSPVSRGFFTKKIYKFSVSYAPNFTFELKDAHREAFEEAFLGFRQAAEKSKQIVG